MEEDKAEGKQAEDKRVFFGFGDDLAVNDNSHRVMGIRRKLRTPEGATPMIIKGSRKEVANRFVDDAGAHSSRRIPVGIGQSAPRNTNSQVIRISIIIHKKMGNGSAATADGDSRRVGGASGKDLRSSASRNPLLNGLDVYRVVGAGKQGRERDGLVGRRVGIENVSVAKPRVANREIARGSDGTTNDCSGRAAKNPEGLVVVVLAGIDADGQLRVRYPPPPPPPPQRQTMATKKNNFRFINIGNLKSSLCS